MNSKSVLRIILKIISFRNFLFFLLQFLFFGNDVLQGQWVMTNGPNDPRISSLVVSGNNIIATGQNGWYLSTNKGVEWIKSVLFEYYPTLAAVGDSVFAITNNGMFFSADNGITFTKFKDFPSNYIISSFAVSGTNFIFGTSDLPGTGYAGIYLSIDNGTSWSQTEYPPGDIISFTVYGSTVFASMSASWGGPDYGGVYQSNNKGADWSGIGYFNNSVFQIAVIGNNIFASAYSGLYLSTNNGVDWKLEDTSKIGKAGSLAVVGNNIFASTYPAGILLSTDKGVNWTQVNEGLPDTTKGVLVVSSTDIYVSVSGSKVWRRPISELVGITNEIKDLPHEFTLSQNYPNPFNPSTQISYSLPYTSQIKLIVYNIQGQTINILENGFKNAGNYSVNFNAADLPSGIYFYRLEAGQFSQVKKMMLIK